MKNVQIGVVMGSRSDWDTMQHAVHIRQQFGIAHEARVVSAHRMPDDMFAYAERSRVPLSAEHAGLELDQAQWRTYCSMKSGPSSAPKQTA